MAGRLGPLVVLLAATAAGIVDVARAADGSFARETAGVMDRLAAASTTEALAAARRDAVELRDRLCMACASTDPNVRDEAWLGFIALEQGMFRYLHATNAIGTDERSAMGRVDSLVRAWVGPDQVVAACQALRDAARAFEASREAGRTRTISPRDASRLRDDLVRAHRTSASPEEVQRLQRRLIEERVETPASVQADVLIPKQASRHAEDLAHFTGAEREAKLARALALGFSLEELRAQPKPRMDAARLVELETAVLTDPGVDWSHDAARELLRISLPESSAGRLLAALEGASDGRFFGLLSALSGTRGERVLAVFWAGASDPSNAPLRRKGYLEALVRADVAGTFAAATLQLLQGDPVFAPADLAHALTSLRISERTDTSAWDMIALLAASPETGESVRRAAIRALGRSPQPKDSGVLFGIVFDSSAPIGIRQAARISLRIRDETKLGDATDIRLLREDGSREFRARLLKEFSQIGPYPGDEGLRAAMEDARRWLAATPDAK